MAVSRLSIGKFLELIITIVCLVLHSKSLESLQEQNDILISGTFLGYTVILIALFAGYILSTPINKRIDIFFSLIGAALFITSGSIILHDWNNEKNSILPHLGANKDLIPIKGGLAIVNGIIFLLDVVFTFRD